MVSFVPTLDGRNSISSIEKAVAKLDKSHVRNPITGNAEVDSMSLEELRFDADIRHRYPLLSNQRKNALADLEAIEKSKILLRKRLERQRRAYERTLKHSSINSSKLEYQVESGVEGDIGELHKGVEPPEQNQTLRDYTGEVPDETSAGEQGQYVDNAQKERLPIESFFCRPVLIDSWTQSAANTAPTNLIQNIFNPWELWSDRPAVRAKLTNYAFFKGDLKIRIALSGNPYSYGRLLVSYVPYAIYNDYLTTAYTSNGMLNNNTVDNDFDHFGMCYVTYLSQMPGARTMDPSTNEPLDITLPFISYKQAHRIYNTSATAIGNANAFIDFQEAGRLYFVWMNRPKTSNADPDAEVTVTTYAYCDNIELGNPTGTNIDITAESGVMKSGRKRNPKPQNTKERASVVVRTKDLIDAAISDEYEAEGPVSKVASAVSKAAVELSGVPVIGGFATATGAVANTIGKLASWFGFSKPVVLEPAIYVKNNPFQNGATTAGGETTMKIAVDPKQELSMSLDLGGTDGSDDMVIQKIAAREGFFTKFVWSQADDPLSTPIWKCLNTPLLANMALKPTGATDGTDTLVQPTPMYFATLPFDYWRGSITYRFEIVCSRFHRGKLQITYEPNVPMEALISADVVRLNQQNTLIVDIQETQEVEFTVDWVYPRAWCKSFTSNSITEAPADMLSWLGSSTAQFGVPAGQSGNFAGYIFVAPYTRLIQPQDGVDIEVNVYVRCEDLEVARPNESFQNSRSYTFHTESGMLDKGNSKHVNDTFIVDNSASKEGIHLHHFGEKIGSFRALLKRYNTLWSEVGQTAMNTNEIALYTVSTIYSASPRPIGNDTANNAILYSGNLFDYLRYAYLGARGGMRFRYLCSSEATLISRYTKVILEPEYGWTATNLITDLKTEDASVTGNDLNVFGRNSPAGTLTYFVDSNGGIEYEMPFYDNNLFRFSNSNDWGASVATGLAQGQLGYITFGTNRYTVSSIVRNRSETPYNVIVDQATAEDFTFLRFQAAGFFSVFIDYT